MLIRSKTNGDVNDMIFGRNKINAGAGFPGKSLSGILSLFLIILCCFLTGCGRKDFYDFARYGPPGLIAFTTDRDGVAEIYVMEADGSSQKRLTTIGACGTPSFSTDGNNIVFVSIDAGVDKINVIDVDGSNLQNLSGAEWHYDCTFSYDGTRIIFKEDSTGEIYTMDRTGSNIQQITSFGTTIGGPCFSPDGKKIAYSKRIVIGNDDIFIMDLATSTETRLTEPFTTIETDPTWSPDGEKIAFSTDRDGNYEIYVINADGSNPVRLTNNTAYDSYPSWSHDGRKIVFTSDRDGDYEIFIMNADGSNQVQLTFNTDIDHTPAFQYKPR